MRVLWVNTTSAMGGAEYSLFEAVSALKESLPRLEIAVAVPDGALYDMLRDIDVDCLSIEQLRLRRPSLRHPETLGSFHTLAKVRCQLRRHIGRFSPDLVHANSLAALLALPSRLKCGVIWHVRDLRFPGWCMRRKIRGVDSFIAISNSVAANLSRYLDSAAQARIEILHNGIRLPDFAGLPSREGACDELGLPPNGMIVGMLAHLVPWKRQDLFIEMAARLRVRYPHATFALAGADLFDEHRAYRAALHGMVAKLGLTKDFYFLGETKAPSHYLRSLDILVHPAVAEPFGRVLCEAMAVGTPVVAVGSAGPQEIIEEGHTGLLAEADSASLEVCVGRLLDDERLRRRLAEEARRSVEQNFDIRRVARQLALLYSRFE